VIKCYSIQLLKSVAFPVRPLDSLGIQQHTLHCARPSYNLEGSFSLRPIQLHWNGAGFIPRKRHLLNSDKCGAKCCLRSMELQAPLIPDHSAGALWSANEAWREAELCVVPRLP
jgi:hypothetical protein